MPRQNIIFSVVAPLVLMIIIAVIVVGIGETLLAVHHESEIYYHVEAYPKDSAEYRLAREIAALPAVVVAMAIATMFLIGGAVASRLAPQPKH